MKKTLDANSVHTHPWLQTANIHMSILTPLHTHKTQVSYLISPLHFYYFLLCFHFNPSQDCIHPPSVYIALEEAYIQQLLLLGQNGQTLVFIFFSPIELSLSLCWLFLQDLIMQAISVIVASPKEPWYSYTCDLQNMGFLPNKENDLLVLKLPIITQAISFLMLTFISSSLDTSLRHNVPLSFCGILRYLNAWKQCVLIKNKRISITNLSSLHMLITFTCWELHGHIIKTWKAENISRK